MVEQNGRILIIRVLRISRKNNRYRFRTFLSFFKIINRSGKNHPVNVFGTMKSSISVDVKT